MTGSECDIAILGGGLAGRPIVRAPARRLQVSLRARAAGQPPLQVSA